MVESTHDKIYNKVYNGALLRCVDTNHDGIITYKEKDDFTVDWIKNQGVTMIMGQGRPLNPSGEKVSTATLIEWLKETCLK